MPVSRRDFLKLVVSSGSVLGLPLTVVGIPLQNPDQPIEALRVIHSYDPCLSCAVHVMRPKGKPVVFEEFRPQAQLGVSP